MPSVVPAQRIRRRIPRAHAVMASPARPEPDTRSRLLDAAIERFGRDGFAATRISDIAADAGLGKGTAYLYWRTKEDLLLDACELVGRRTEDEKAAATGFSADGAEPAPDGRHPIARIVHLLESSIALQLRTMRRMHRIFAELASICFADPAMHARGRATVTAVNAGWRDVAVRLYRSGVAAGVVRRTDHGERFAELVVATVDGLVWQSAWLPMPDADQVARDAARAIVETIMREPDRLDEFLTVGTPARRGRR